MNCKPNEIAIIINDINNSGALVRIIEELIVPEGLSMPNTGFVWKVEVLQNVIGQKVKVDFLGLLSVQEKTLPAGSIAGVPDKNLRSSSPRRRC